MSVLTRFRDIMASNINTILDKVEDPDKMVEQYLRNLTSDLGKVKAETASIMAEEMRAKRAWNELTEEINKLQNYAIKALEADNETDARKFLERKAVLAEEETGKKEAYDLAAANAKKMREMHDKLVADIQELEARKEMIKGKLAVAKTRDRMNRIGFSLDGANSSISAFDRMEAKANQALDKANAMAELNVQAKDDLKDLMDKYEKNSDIDNELEVLKASLKVK